MDSIGTKSMTTFPDSPFVSKHPGKFPSIWYTTVTDSIPSEWKLRFIMNDICITYDPNQASLTINELQSYQYKSMWNWYMHD